MIAIAALVTADQSCEHCFAWAKVVSQSVPGYTQSYKGTSVVPSVAQTCVHPLTVGPSLR